MGGATYAVVDHRRQTREGIAVDDVDDDFDFDETAVGDVEQEHLRRRRRRRVVVDSREEEAAAAAATSRDSRGSGGSVTGRSHVEEGLTSKEGSVPTSSNIFDLREDKDEEGGEEEEGGDVVLDRETHHPRGRFSRRGRDDDSMSSSSSGSGGGGRGSGGRGRGRGGDTTGTPCFVTHGYGAQEVTTAASAVAAVNGVRGVERVGGRVDGGNAVAVGGGSGGRSGLYEDGGSDCSSYGSTLTLGRPEPSSVHWKYSRRLLQT